MKISKSTIESMTPERKTILRNIKVEFFDTPGYRKFGKIWEELIILETIYQLELMGELNSEKWV